MNLLYLMAQSYSSGGSLLELLGLIVLFVLVIVACYFVTRFVAGKQISRQANSNFKVIDTFRISQTKYLQLIKVGEKYMVIAVSKETITMLTELTEEELLYKRDQDVEAINFKDILATAFKRSKDQQKIEGNLQQEIENKKNFNSKG